MESITVLNFTKKILDTIPQPWGTDIVDQVFQKIETNPDFLATYTQLTEDHGQYPVENSIGLNILALTGKKNTERVKPAHSTLIQNYSELE